MGAEVLGVTRRNGVVTVTIDHPPLQLVDGAFVTSLAGVVDALAGDAGVTVVVFRSADPDYFLMHGDVRFLAGSRPPAEAADAVDRPNFAAALLERIHRAPYVSIGVLDGIARGGGCEFLSALDVRIGTPRSRVGQPEAPMGILPGAGGTVRWARLVGRAAALELILTGRDLGADELLASGWLQAVVPSEDLEDHVARLCDRLAAVPRDVVAAVKQVVAEAVGDATAPLVAESRALTALMAAGHHVERMRRFLDAGGQTRDGELGDITSLLDAMSAR